MVPDRLTPRARRKVRETRSMEFATTHTEAEALLLEESIKNSLPGTISCSGTTSPFH